MQATEDAIPEGFRWDRNHWTQPRGIKLTKEETRRLQNLVGSRDLERALRYYLKCRRAVIQTRAAFRRAAIFLEGSHCRVDFLDIPGPPWLIDDQVVDWDGHHYRVMEVRPLTTDH
jgi:hypothetical protein